MPPRFAIPSEEQLDVRALVVRARLVGMHPDDIKAWVTAIEKGWNSKGAFLYAIKYRKERINARSFAG
jgi:hypothetical protein